MAAHTGDRMVHPDAVRAMKHQSRIWPSASKGETLIEDMDPIHAFNAWRSMRMQLLHSWAEDQNSELSLALLRQALGEDSFAEFISVTPKFLTEQPVISDTMLFAACHAAIADLAEAAADGPLSTITTAATLANRLKKELNL